MTEEAENVITKAYRIASVAHWNQRDKQEKLYIWHPLRVAQALKDESHVVIAVAFLHDVLEDTDSTKEDLEAGGIPQEVIEAVEALTRDKGNETHVQYIERVADNEIARKVKVADLNDNLARWTEDLGEGLRDRYLAALARLQ